MKIITISGLKQALGIVVGQITDAMDALRNSLSGALADEAGRAQQAEQANAAAITAETAARQQADTQLIPRSIAGALMTNLASYSNGTTILLRKQSVGTASGAIDDVYEAMPVVDNETAGICPPTVYCQVVQTAQDVEALKGRRLYYPANLDTVTPSDAQLTAVVEASGGSLLDGVTVTDFNHHKDYTYYTATGAWRDRGSSVITIATNASIGAVRGRNEPGYCTVDPDGSLPLVGWDATQEAISMLQSGAVMKSEIPQFIYSMGYLENANFMEWRFMFMSLSNTTFINRVFIPLCTDTNNGDFKMRKLEVSEINITG